MPPPVAIFVAGPNGAGKSTLIEELAGGWTDYELVLADVQASVYVSLGHTQQVADLKAARDVVSCFRRLIQQPANFVNETNLVDLSHRRTIRAMRAKGYRAEMIFVAVDHPDLAVARVAKRVAEGGHPVLEPTIRRRWPKGLLNFFNIYRHEVDSWAFYDSTDGVELVATGQMAADARVESPATWMKYLQIVDALESKGGRS